MVTIRHLFYSNTWSHCWWTPRFAECDDSRCGIHNTFINYDNLDPGPDPIKKNFSVKLKVLGFCIFRNQLKIEINYIKSLFKLQKLPNSRNIKIKKYHIHLWKLKRKRI